MCLYAFAGRPFNRGDGAHVLVFQYSSLSNSFPLLTKVFPLTDLYVFRRFAEQNNRKVQFLYVYYIFTYYINFIRPRDTIRMVIYLSLSLFLSFSFYLNLPDNVRGKHICIPSNRMSPKYLKNVTTI